MKYDLTTTEGINELIKEELGFFTPNVESNINFKGVIVNLYKKGSEVYKYLGYNMEDCINEAYIWLFEKIKQKKDVMDLAYLKKLLNLELKNRMSNLFNKGLTEQKRTLNNKKNKGEEGYCEDLILNSLYNSTGRELLEDKINWDKIKKLFNDLDNKIIDGIFIEKKSYRKIVKTLKKEGFNVSHQTVSDRLKSILKVLKKNLKNIFTID